MSFSYLQIEHDKIQLELEQLPNLSSYQSRSIFSVNELAMLTASLDPILSAGVFTESAANSVQVHCAHTVRRHVLSAIESGDLSTLRAYVFEQDSYGNIYSSRQIGRDELPESEEIDPTKTKVKREHAIAWLKLVKLRTYEYGLKKRLAIVLADIEVATARLSNNQPAQSGITLEPQAHSILPVMKGVTVDVVCQAIADFPLKYPDYRNNPPLQKQINSYAGDYFREKGDSRKALVFGGVIAESLGIKKE